MHHLLLGHGLATEAVRANDKAPVGIVANVCAMVPASDSPQDRRAAELSYANANTWILDPLLLGTYPEELAGVVAGC